MARVMLPEPIYRGDPWSLPVRLHRDISGSTFACQLRKGIGSTPIQASIDPAHQGDEVDPDDPTNDPYFVVTLTGAQTAAIKDNVLKGDVQEVGAKTVARFTVIVDGQIEEPAE